MIERTALPAATGAFTLFVAFSVLATDRPPGQTVVAAVAAVALAALAAWRRATGWPLSGLLFLACLGIAFLAHGTSANLGWFGLAVAAGWVAYTSSLVVTVATSAALLAIMLEEALALTAEPGWGAWSAGVAFAAVAMALARRQRLLADELRAAQVELAERARAEERNRVAGEIHDSVGHGLTVALLHISGARLALEDDPGEAAAALAEAERLTRASLEEVRTTVGLVRRAGPDGPGSGLSPLPAATDLPELVDSFRRAGTPAVLEVAGELGAIGAARGLALYRIVQESLTNAARHGDGSPVQVSVTVGPAATQVEVLSGGRADPAASEGSGLLGMRERAEAVGGTLSYAADPPGWRVEAVFPG